MRPTAVILDWAGTTVDYGSCGPAAAFQQIFASRGVTLTVAEAREPMGRAKRDHIAAVSRMPRVAAAWRARHGADCTDADIDRMYADFLPLQKQVLAGRSGVIPGVADAIAKLRASGCPIGSSTGYTRELMEVVMPLAAAQGYRPDVVCTADDVPQGRPEPLLNRLVAQQLGVELSPSVIVVDDTPVGIEAGLRAGCTTVAVSKTGNMLGLDECEAKALCPAKLSASLRRIEADFRSLGAHHVIESVADLPDLFGRL
jgi:phosphonoacetaldehyde hydrolase